MLCQVTESTLAESNDPFADVAKLAADCIEEQKSLIMVQPQDICLNSENREDYGVVGCEETTSTGMSTQGLQGVISSAEGLRETVSSNNIPATLMTVPVKTVGGDCEEQEHEPQEELKQDPLTLSSSFTN